MTKTERRLPCTVFLLSLFLPWVVLGQDESANPKPAAHTYAPPPLYFGQDQNANDSVNDAEGLQPDAHPLTGVQAPTLGTPGLRHSYWLPGFQYGNIGRSSSLFQQTSPDWSSSSYVVGNLSLLQSWSGAQLAINYSGGGVLAPVRAGGDSQFHQLGVVQTLNWNRLQLAIIDQFSYLPETQFGFGGNTGLSIPGGGIALAPTLPGLLSAYVPDQGIFTTFGSRGSNASVVEATYTITPRSSVTAAGSFGILRFAQSDNIESNKAAGSLGYNYAVSRKDTIGFVYVYSSYHFISNPQAIGDHAAYLAYERKLTSRLALQLYGGPDVATFRVPIGTSKQRTSGSGGATLVLGMRRGTASFSYNHGLTSGSGVFTGADADQFQGRLNWQISRVWAGNVNMGYSRNGNILSTANSQSFNSWYAGAGLSRPMGRNATISLGYTAQIQNSNQAVCAAGICGTSFTVHQVSLGFGWHARPFVLQ